MAFRNTHTVGRRTIVTTGHKRHVCKCCYLSDRVEAKESNKNESNAAINSPIARAAHYPALLTHAKAHVSPIRHSGAQPADSERGAGRLTFTCKMNVTLWMYECVSVRVFICSRIRSRCSAGDNEAAHTLQSRQICRNSNCRHRLSLDARSIACTARKTHRQTNPVSLGQEMRSTSGIGWK